MKRDIYIPYQRNFGNAIPKVKSSKRPAPSKGSDFSKKVIQVISESKKGDLFSYKDVASRAGNARAARAVGNILNKYFKDCAGAGKKTIPCHRVIRSDGKLGGYAGGLAEKRELLENEKRP